MSGRGGEGRASEGPRAGGDEGRAGQPPRAGGDEGAGVAARRALIVVPTYDEAGNLEPLVEAVLRAAPGATLLVVDDASPDGTGRLAERLAASQPRLCVLHRPRKLGLGTAYVDGFRWGLARDYGLFFEMDADFSHDPRDLPRLFDALARGADVVIGSRNVPGGSAEGWAPWRRLLSRGGSLCARTLLRSGVRDMTSGFKAFTREALEALELGSLRARGFAFQIETTHRALARGLDVVEVPVAFAARRAGRSKLSYAIVFEAARVLWRLRRRRGGAAGGRGRIR